MPLFDDERTDNQEFEDRRNRQVRPSGQYERRQFGNSHYGLSPQAKELAEAIDNYKMKNRRRFITCEEMLDVIHSLGYAKQAVTAEPAS